MIAKRPRGSPLQETQQAHCPQLLSLIHYVYDERYNESGSAMASMADCRAMAPLASLRRYQQPGMARGDRRWRALCAAPVSRSQPTTTPALRSGSAQRLVERKPAVSLATAHQ